MISASHLAGFFGAHAIWCVSDGETLIPMLAYTQENGERTMNRLAGELEAAVAFGKEQLASNPMDANDAVLLYDGYVTVGETQFDAIFVEIRAYFSPRSEVVVALPYTALASGTFRVHRPQLLVWKECEDFDVDQALQAFWSGASSHEEGFKVWSAALDETM